LNLIFSLQKIILFVSWKLKRKLLIFWFFEVIK
jgi:hypothetical protein